MKDFLSNINHLDVTARLRVTEKNVAGGSYSDVSRGDLVGNNGRTMAVAIKTFRHRKNNTAASDPVMNLEKLRKKLRQEANIWGRLDHPNVAPLLGFSIPADGPPSLISHWYPNGNLKTYLTSSPDDHRTRILYDLSCGLEYLHSLDIVHGDIKPENVLVDADGRACWCDFGLAHFLEGANGITGETSSSTFRNGTASFFSPEQMESDCDAERKTTMMDIWAFGCLMAQVLSGKPLYGGCKSARVCVKISKGELPMDTKSQATLDPAQKPLWAIVDLCWCKDPNSRPTALEISNGISKLVDPSEMLVQIRIRYHVGFGSTPLRPMPNLVTAQINLSRIAACFFFFKSRPRNL